jgi:hypothetical protein
VANLIILAIREFIKRKLSTLIGIYPAEYLLSCHDKKKKSMKKILLASLILIFSLSVSHAQNVLNPGFESWTAGNPVDWMTNNFSTTLPVTQFSDAHSGSSSARGEVISFGASPYAPLLASGPTYGFPMTQAFTTIEFWYKYSGVSGDALFVQGSVYDAAHSPIGYAGDYLVPSASYVHAFIPVYYIGSNPASCILNFSITDTSSAATGTHLGSFFLLDDVVMTNASAGMQENSIAAFNLKSFPNPSVGKTVVSYTLKTVSDVTINVFDLRGKKIVSRSHARMSAGKQEESFDLGEVAAGKYICLLRTDSGTASTMIEVVK